MRALCVFSAMAVAGWSLSVPAGGYPTHEVAAARSANLMLQVQIEDTTIGQQFVRCCWAQGRSAFKYCQEYGVCASQGEGALCAGRGEADGQELVCGATPPETSAAD